MSDVKYTITRSEYTSQDRWVSELLLNQDALSGFLLQFQSCFGRSAAVKVDSNGAPLPDNRGLFLSIPEMLAAAEQIGWKLSQSKLERNLKTLVELGILAKAKVTEHPRSPVIYFLNRNKPFEFDGLAEEKAAQQREKSAYRFQAQNSAAKKARVAEVLLAREPIQEVEPVHPARIEEVPEMPAELDPEDDLRRRRREQDEQKRRAAVEAREARERGLTEEELATQAQQRAERQRQKLDDDFAVIVAGL